MRSAQLRYYSVGERYAYDLCGNRLLKEQYSGSSVDVTEGYRYNERNELTERISGGSLTRYNYDKNGSIISEEKEGRKSEYRYDLLNRQTYVKTLDGKEQENFYDGEGLRAGLTENGKKTTFLFHNGEILTESDGESAPIRRYLTGLGLSHVQTKDGAYHAYHQDEQGSTGYITGQGVENCYQYDAFGNLTDKKEGIENRILYTGQQYDQETGQYYLRARYYNPVVGRFLQEDTYRGDGLNLYAYCANNPVSYFDPSGQGRKSKASCGNETTQKKQPETQGQQAGNKPPNLSPEGAGRRGAFREAKRQNGVPVCEQPEVKPNIDKRGNRQPGRIYEFENGVQIRDDVGGHEFPDNPSQNRGSHFNDPDGNHFDY